MNILELIKHFLRPAVDDPADPPAEQVVADDATDPASDLEVDLDEGTPPADERPSPEEFAAAQAAAKADKDRADRLERELLEVKTRPSAPRDEQFDREEERLKDPKIEPLEKWQIEANRELRRGRSEAQFALAQAQDVSDRTAFSQLAVTNAPLYNRYKVKVEEELAKMRSQGRNAPRETLLDYLVGRDMRNGVFTKKKGAAPKEGEPVSSSVPRGKLPGARSDVSGRSGAMTNKQKLEKKLDGVQI